MRDEGVYSSLIRLFTVVTSFPIRHTTKFSSFFPSFKRVCTNERRERMINKSS